MFLLALAFFLLVSEHDVTGGIQKATPAELAEVPGWIRPLIACLNANGVGYIEALHRSAELFAGPILTLVMSAHLFAQLRGMYGGSAAKTLLRMAALAFFRSSHFCCCCFAGWRPRWG